jgi:hypothetical protein
MGTKVQFGKTKKKKKSRSDSLDSCTAMCIYLMPLNLHLKMDTTVNFMLCTFYCN